MLSDLFSFRCAAHILIAIVQLFAILFSPILFIFDKNPNPILINK